jgi:hypothetical protein
MKSISSRKSKKQEKQKAEQQKEKQKSKKRSRKAEKWTSREAGKAEKKKSKVDKQRSRKSRQAKQRTRNPRKNPKPAAKKLPEINSSPLTFASPVLPSKGYMITEIMEYIPSEFFLAIKLDQVIGFVFMPILGMIFAYHMGKRAGRQEGQQLHHGRAQVITRFDGQSSPD